MTVHATKLFSAPSSNKMRWNLLGKNSTDFKYTQGSSKQVAFLQCTNDGDQFINTINALQQLGINSVTSDHLFRILSGILHLGQVTISTTFTFLINYSILFVTL